MIRYKFKTQKLQYWQPHTIQPFCQSWTRRKVGAFFFYVPAIFCISLSPLQSSLLSLITNYNPSHELLTQLQTLTNFLRRLRLNDVTLDLLWVLAPLNPYKHPKGCSLLVAFL